MIPALAPLVFEAALRALLAATAVWAGLRLLRIGNVLVQKAAWGMVLVAALAMPLAPRWLEVSTFAAFRLPALLSTQAFVPAAPAAAQPTPPEEETPQSTAAQSSSPIANLEPAPAISSAIFNSPAPSVREPEPSASSSRVASQPDTPGASPTRIRLAALVSFMYLGVLAALLLRLLLGLASALRLWSHATPIPALPGSNPTTRLRSSPRVASPVNIGSGIVLPADYAAWDEEKLRIVLAHERSHVRQGDFYLQIFASLYAALFWFSPLGWWLKRKLSELSEAISDRAGLQQSVSRSSYAQILLEFAALPRPPLTGVAMARTSHLTQRIERLLNESTFRQSFASGGRRALLAVLLVPAALFAATALVRVEAAASPAPQTQATPQDQTTGQSTPQQVTDQAAIPAPVPAEAPAPAATDQPATPAPVPEPAAVPAPPPMNADDPGPAPMAPPTPNPIVVAVPPMPPVTVRIPSNAVHVRIDPAIRAQIAAARDAAKQSRDYARGDAYTIVGDPGTKVRINGVWDGDRAAEFEKARKIAHGRFLWFRHDGKSYIVDDPAIVAQVEAMNKPMDDLRDQMRALGDQMRALGRQQRERGRQMRDVTVPTPDLSRQIAELNAALAAFQAKQGATISQQQLRDLQRELGRIQGQIGALQGKIVMQQINLDGGMGKFGEQQGKLGEQMGKLGQQMGQLARENQSKIKSIIDQSLSNGQAKPVE